MSCDGFFFLIERRDPGAHIHDGRVDWRGVEPGLYSIHGVLYVRRKMSASIDVVSTRE